MFVFTVFGLVVEPGPTTRPRLVYILPAGPGTTGLRVWWANVLRCEEGESPIFSPLANPTVMVGIQSHLFELHAVAEFAAVKSPLDGDVAAERKDCFRPELVAFRKELASYSPGEVECCFDRDCLIFFFCFHVVG